MGVAWLRETLPLLCSGYVILILAVALAILGKGGGDFDSLGRKWGRGHSPDYEPCLPKGQCLGKDCGFEIRSWTLFPAIGGLIWCFRQRR